MTLKAEIRPNDNLIAVRHMKKHARTRHMAAVMLSNVEIVQTRARGTLTGEFETEITWDSLEIPAAIKSKFRRAAVGEKFTDAKTRKPVTKAKVLVGMGKDYFYLP